MDKDSDGTPSPSPRRKTNPTISPAPNIAAASRNAFESNLSNASGGRSNSDGIVLPTNFHPNQRLAPLNASYPQGRQGNSFWQYGNGQKNAFWQRLVEEQQQQEANMAASIDQSPQASTSSQREEDKIFAQSPDPSTQPTHRQAVEMKNDERLLQLIRNGGATSSSTQIANIRRAGAPAPLNLDSNFNSASKTKTLPPEPSSPRKRFLNKLGIGTGPALKPPQGTETASPEPSKGIPPKAAQLLGTSEIPARQRTPAPITIQSAQVSHSSQTGSRQDEKIPSAVFFTPDRINAITSAREAQGTPKQGLLLRNEHITQRLHAHGAPRLDFYNGEAPPTPPSKDRPRGKPEITLPAATCNALITTNLDTRGLKKPDVSTSAQLGQPSPTLGPSHQRHYPQVLQRNTPPRSFHGTFGNMADLAPSPKPDMAKRDGINSAVSRDDKEKNDAMSPIVRVIHPSGERRGPGTNSTTVYSPSIYGERTWSVSGRKDPWTTPNLYPGPLHVPPRISDGSTSNDSGGRSREFSNSTSASVPLFFENNHTASSSAAQEQTNQEMGADYHELAKDSLHPPHAMRERPETPHRPSYETLTSVDTSRKASDPASTHAALVHHTDDHTTPRAKNNTHHNAPPSAYRTTATTIQEVLGQNFSILVDRLDSVESHLQDISTHMNGLDTRFTGIDTRLESLGTGLETLDTYMASLDARLAAVETHLADNMPSRATKPDIEAINTRIETLEAKADKSVRLGETVLKQLRSTSEFLASVKNDVNSLSGNFVKFVKAQHEYASGAKRSNAYTAANRDSSNTTREAVDTNAGKSAIQGYASGTSGTSSGRDGRVETPSTANSSTGNYVPSPYQQVVQQSPPHRRQRQDLNPQASRRDISQSPTRLSPRRHNNSDQSRLDQEQQSHFSRSQGSSHAHSSPAGPLPTAESLPEEAHRAYFDSLGRDRSVPDIFAHPAYRNTH